MRYLLKAACMAAVVCPIGLASCSKNSNSPSNTTGTSTVRITNNASLGAVLTDSAGNTLYFYSPDVSGQSSCTGGCLAAWPSYKGWPGAGIWPVAREFSNPAP